MGPSAAVGRLNRTASCGSPAALKATGARLSGGQIRRSKISSIFELIASILVLYVILLYRHFNEYCKKSADIFTIRQKI